MGGLTVGSPSQPIMSDGSGPPAREGGWFGVWGGEKGGTMGDREEK